MLTRKETESSLLDLAVKILFTLMLFSVSIFLSSSEVVFEQTLLTQKIRFFLSSLAAFNEEPALEPIIVLGLALFQRYCIIENIGPCY